MSATEPLSPLDATFLELEEADVTRAHAHRRGAGLRPAARTAARRRSRELRRHLERAPRRAAALPPAALAAARTGGLRWPAWEPDERFDIAATSPAPRCPRRAASASCSLGRPTSGRTASTAPAAVAHRPARGPRRRALGAGDQDPPLPGGRRRLGRRGHRAARRRAEARRGSRRRRPHRRRRRAARAGRAAPPGRPADGRHRGARSTPCAIRGAPPRRSTPRAALVELLVRDELVAAPQDEPQRPARRAPPARRDGGAARGAQGDQARARAARSTTSCSRSSPPGCASCSSRAARRRPPRACARWCR